MNSCALRIRMHLCQMEHIRCGVPIARISPLAFANVARLAFGIAHRHGKCIIFQSMRAAVNKLNRRRDSRRKLDKKTTDEPGWLQCQARPENRDAANMAWQHCRMSGKRAAPHRQSSTISSAQLSSAQHSGAAAFKCKCKWP